MTRITEAALLHFCTQQHTCFQTQAWLAYPHPVREELAAAALFLAAVDWYGHREALQEIASTLDPVAWATLQTWQNVQDLTAADFQTL